MILNRPVFTENHTPLAKIHTLNHSPQTIPYGSLRFDSGKYSENCERDGRSLYRKLYLSTRLLVVNWLCVAGNSHLSRAWASRGSMSDCAHLSFARRERKVRLLQI